MTTLPKILITDDEPSMLRLLTYNVGKMGYTTFTANDGVECINKICNESFDVLILDVNLPKKNGLSVLEEVSNKFPNIPVVMATAADDVDTAVKAIKMGAYDYLVKPIDISRLETVLKNALSFRELKKEVNDLKSNLLESELFSEIIGESKRLKEVFSLTDKALNTDINVLIIGESGTGKELLARAIHQGSGYSKGPFIAVNCAAITLELADSLLFGHKRGSFTGAFEDRPGFFEQAQGGTIFLDEIGDMNLEIQSKILRILEESAVKRVGEKIDRKLNFRLISATNIDLVSAIKENRFRKDLYFRLEEYPIFIPPLRERTEDIPKLVEHFISESCIKNKHNKKTFSKDALKKLINHSWPGNIRELRNIVKRSLIQSDSKVIEDVFFSRVEEIIPQNKTSDIYKNDDIVPLDTVERDAIFKAYNLAERNVADAAKLLGISRATMYRKLEKLGIS